MVENGHSRTIPLPGLLVAEIRRLSCCVTFKGLNFSLIPFQVVNIAVTNLVLLDLNVLPPLHANLQALVDDRESCALCHEYIEPQVNNGVPFSLHCKRVAELVAPDSYTTACLVVVPRERVHFFLPLDMTGRTTRQACYCPNQIALGRRLGNRLRGSLHPTRLREPPN